MPKLTHRIFNERANLLANQLDQFNIHVLVVIRNIENVQWFKADLVKKIRLNARLVLLPHNKDQVSPTDVGDGQALSCATVCAG